MKNIQAKRKLVKIAQQLVAMPQSLEREYFIEDVWEQCFKAFPEKKTSEDNWYISEVRMWDIIEDAIELFEETA